MPPTPDVTGQQLVAEATRHVGAPYVYGAEGPNTFDCSGLMQYVYAKFGLKIPRTSEEQWKAGRQITKDRLQLGDLVFSTGSSGSASRPGHVGMYAGRHDFGGTTGSVPAVLEAPKPGDSVKWLPLDWFDATGYRRMTGVAPTSGDVIDAGLIDDFTQGLGSLLQFPEQIIGFYGKALDDLSALGEWFGAFTRPSTWVRIGAGIIGFWFLVAGLVFLIVAGQQS